MADLPVMVITGTSKGIGRGLANYFVGKGYRVVGCSRGPITFELDGYRHDQVDVSNEKQVRDWIRAIKKTYQRIDVLVCNASLIQLPSLLTMTPGAVLEPILLTNIAGTYYVCREVAKIMMLQKYGRIITISSFSVGVHFEGTSAYTTSKSAVIELSKILAKELAPSGITCNVLSPSMVMTESVRALGADVAKLVNNAQTIKREQSIEEIGHAISFFAAEESGCITGQVLYMGLVD
jgi:3-oxoacyl-[acyl-carrier protein] reductase